MISSICTLFEGHYHYGVSALANSLYNQGYRGNIYVGYRGTLPSWSKNAKKSSFPEWPNSHTLEIATGLELHFLLLSTDYHLTNYKPDFILSLWQSIASKADAIYYFDPDIVVTTPWSLFEDWSACGVALCEDVNSPLAIHHPIRSAWRRYFEFSGFTLHFKEAIYANGGFVGLTKKHISFIETWQKIQEAMAVAIGGLNHSAFTSVDSSPFAPFGKTDQDALNATVEAWEGPVSFLGKEGMAFNASPSIMSHAIGESKPWLRKYLAQAVAGHPPRRADRDYWSAANGPIISQPASLVRLQRILIMLTAGIGRFYSKKW